MEPDELLKAHPLPWRIDGDMVADANAAPIIFLDTIDEWEVWPTIIKIINREAANA